MDRGSLRPPAHHRNLDSQDRKAGEEHPCEEHFVHVSDDQQVVRQQFKYASRWIDEVENGDNCGKARPDFQS